MPEPVNLAFAFNLPPAQALEYFRAKGYRVNPDGWAAVEAAANRKAFTVARVASLDLLQDIKSSMDQAMANGTTFAQFQKELMPKMKALGWWGKDERGVQLGSPHRLSTIFRTNAQTSYMEGRWRGLMENVDNRPWIEYVAILDSRTRPGHRALNGKVFRYDDPFWRTHRPPLGWNCRCRIRALNDRDLERRGITPDQGEGNIKQYTPEAQGYRQPQAGYVDPATGTETRTDIGWGYDRLEGWTPPPGRYDPGLRGLLDEVYKLKNLAQSTHVNSGNPLDIRCRDMLMNMAAMASVAGGYPDRFIGLWKSRGDYDKHLAKRQREQAVMTGEDYAAKTFEVIAQAKSMTLVLSSNDFATGKLQIEADGWIVLVGNDGHIVTSYRYMPDKIEFLARHREAGDIIHEYRLDEELRKILDSIFNRP